MSNKQWDSLDRDKKSKAVNAFLKDAKREYNVQEELEYIEHSILDPLPIIEFDGDIEDFE